MNTTPPHPVATRFSSPTLRLAAALGITPEPPPPPVCDHPLHRSIPATAWVVTPYRGGDLVRAACELCAADANTETREGTHAHELTPITEPRPTFRQQRLL